jgi:hypothetical protein
MPGEKDNIEGRRSEIYLDLYNSGIIYKIYDCGGDGEWLRDVVVPFQLFRKTGAHSYFQRFVRMIRDSWLTKIQQ